jgi:glutathionylspermidine synthase
MPTFFPIKPIPKDALDKMNYTWHNDKDGEYILKTAVISLSEKEVQAYHDVSNELYKMYEKGAQYVIENNLFDALDIPTALIPHIKESWQNERDNHLYGRFDLSGGIDGRPIKLIEFNADTPTLLLESSVIQAMLLNGLEDASQYNNVYEAIALKFEKLAKSKKGEFTRFLFSCVQNIEEERITTQLLQEMATHKGLITRFEYLENLDFQNREEFWFKLFPWEDMENFESNASISMLNPAFTLLYQSKGMLAILYELFPDSPYLLKTSFEPIKEKYVKKRMFGREGANIDIVEDGKVLTTTDGIYDEYKAVYQEYENFVKDEEGNYYQAGVFYSDGACGLGFRRGAEILDDMSVFVGHIVL